MYTVCPKCTLALAVAAADLRAGQGYVRCGRCTNVFNALLNLRDESETSPGLPLDETATASFMMEPTPLAGEDRRARVREPVPSPQAGLDLDLSPPPPAPPAETEPEPQPEAGAGPEPEAIVLAEAGPEPAPAAPVAESPALAALDLAIPDASPDDPALDLVVESASAEEPDLDIVFDPSEEHEILRPVPPAPAPAPAAPAAGAAAPAAPAPVAGPAPAAAPAAAPTPLTLPPQGLTPQGHAPLSAERPRTPLPATGLTPLHATGGRLAQGGEGEEEFRGTGTYETIVLQGDSILQTEELLPEQEFDDRIAAVAHQLEADGAGQAAARPAAVASGLDATTSSGSWPLLEQPDEDGAPEDAARADALAAEIAAAVAGLGPTAALRQPRWLVAALCALALLLGAQAVHHWRNRLATSPALNGPLTRLYARFGVTLAPEWDLAAYDLRLLGASADPQDTRVIHVRMSLASHAAVAQALPLVRLRLIDRYGKALGSGDLQPAQYLPAGVPHQAFLQPDQRIDSDVRVLDPTQQASSFELDVCLPRPGGGLHCAGDLAFAGGHS